MFQRFSYIVCLVLLLVTSPLRAQWGYTSGDSWVNTDYNTTEGKDFWVTYISSGGNQGQDMNNLKIRIFATARQKTNIKVIYADGSTESFQVEAMKRAIHDLNLSKAYILLGEEVDARAVHVQSNNPISLYAVSQNPVAGSQDGTNVYPTAALSKEYVIQTYGSDKWSTEFALLSTKDYTYVDLEIHKVYDSIVFGPSDQYADSIITKRIYLPYAGSVYLYRSKQAEYSLSGTKICATQPIAVFQGGQEAMIPYGTSNSNHIYSQVMPTDMWGKTYVATSTKNQKEDYYRLTSLMDGTRITRDNDLLTTLNVSETCQDTLHSPKNVDRSVVYRSTNPFMLNAYLTDAIVNGDSTYYEDEDDYEVSTRYGAPAMSPITPIELGVRSLVFSTLDAQNIKAHYINVVTYTSTKNQMRLDGDKPITLTDIPNTPYSFAVIKLDTGAHVLTNNNRGVEGVFTAYLYGLGRNSMDKKESYAYSAGSRIERSIDMLIDGQYIKQKNLCVPNGTTFTPIINHDYDNYHWEFMPDNYLSYPIISDNYTSIQNYTTHLPDPGTWTARLIVNYTTPLCQNAIRDTVVAYITMHDLVHLDRGYNDQQQRNICYGESFYVHYEGRKRYDYIADTTTTQQIFGENTKFKVNTEYVFKDTIPNEWGCDSVIWQYVTIRPASDVVIYDTICYQHLPYKWRRKDNGALIKTLTKEDLYNKHDLHLTTEDAFLVDSIVTSKENLKSPYGCDSLVQLKLLVMPDYLLADGSEDVCQDASHGYNWHSSTNSKHKHTNEEGKVLSGHNKVWMTNQETNKKVHIYPGQYIPLTTPGTFTLVDSLKTIHVCKTCGEAIGCDSVHTKTIVVQERKQKILPELNLCDNETIVALNDTLCVGHKYKGIIPDPWKSANRYIILSGDKTFVNHSPTQDALQCDSITIQQVHLCPTYEKNLPVVSLCQSESKYDWKRVDNGQLIKSIDIPTSDHYPVSFEYTDTLQTNSACGCDSILHLTLTINPTYDTILYDTICDTNLPYKWTVHNNYTNRNQTINITRPASEAQNIWHTSQQAPLQTKKGCDSIVTLDLIVYPTLYTDVNIQLCPDQLPYQYCENGATVPKNYKGGTETETIPSKQFPIACDSVITYHINVSDENINRIDVRRCDDNLPYSYDYPPLPPNATHTRLLTDISETGIYDDTVSIEGQCRTIYQLNFTVDKTYDKTLPQVNVCVNNLPYAWRVTDTKGNSRTISINIPEDKVLPFDTLCTANLKSIHDCDSTMHLPLRVHPTYTKQLYDTICEKALPYTWRDNKGVSLKQIRLTDIRNSGQWKDPDWTYTTEYNHYSQYSCDSLLILHLTIYPTLYKDTTIQLCPDQLPYQYCENGATVPKNYKGGIETETIPSKQFPMACDSIITYHINVSDEDRHVFYDTLCNNELPYSYPYPDDGIESQPIEKRRLVNLYRDTIAYDTMRHDGHCLHILELHLHINDTTISKKTYYHCDGERYVDIDFPTITATKDTSYVKRLSKANRIGCDSVVYVTVKFGKTYSVHDPDVVLCEKEYQYTWNTRDTHGNYQHLLKWSDLNERVLDTTLYDTLHTISPYKCDSITSVHISVMPTTYNEFSVVWCASAGAYPYGEKNKTATTTGTYIDTLITKNHFGCDSVLSIHLEWKDSIYFYDTVSICDNKVYSKHQILFVGDKYTSFGGTYNESLYDSVKIYSAGIYHDTVTFKTAIGCDSTFYLTINVSKTHNSIQERNACQFEDVTYEAMHNGYGGKVPTDALGDVVFIDTITALGNGCDSIIQMTYHIRPNYHFSQGDIVLCQAIDSIWTWYNEDGDAQKTISLTKGDTTYTLGTEYKTIYGCDSTYGITVYVAPIYHFYDTLTLCENDSLSWQGILFTGREFGNYHPRGYDATQYRRTQDALTGRQDYYVDTAQYYTIYECDSVYHLALKVNPMHRKTIERRSCQTPDGYYYEPLNNGVGGILPALHLSDSLQRNDTLKNIYDCDSIITLKYYVDSVYRYGVSYTFCQDTIDTMREWIDEEGKSHGFVLDISRPGDFSKTINLKTIHDCDSTYGVTWHVDPIYRFDTIINICEDERAVWQDTLYTGDSVRVMTAQDTVIMTPGTYYRYKHFTTVAGCDSDYYAQINVHAIYDTLTRKIVCENEGFIWHQTDHNGSYADVIFPISYCDTVRLYPYEADFIQTKRDTVMRYATRMLETVHGCDSLSRLILTVYPSYFFYTDTTICANYRFKYRGKYFTSKDTVYTEYLKTSDGCDSIYQLRLHVRPLFMNTRRVTMCDNETLYHTSLNGGEVVWSPGHEIRDPEWEYYDMIYTDENGCDSIYRYYLYIYPAYLFSDTTTMCSTDSLLLHGDYYVGEHIEYPVEEYIEPYQVYYADSLSTIHGCDSVYEIFATIYPVYRHRDTITICDDGQATWREKIYYGFMYGNVPGNGLPVGEHIFRDSLHTYAHGCDSIYELHLFVTPTYLFEEHVTKCADEDMTWHGHNMDHLAVGTYFYFDSLTTVIYGCDSVYHLYLTVNDTTYEIRDDTICRTEVYDLHGKGLTESGYYHDTTLNEWGCHHFTYLYLTVIEPTVPTAWADSICADEDAYDLFYTYTGDLDPIAYSVYYDDEGHFYGFEDVVNQPITHPDELSWLRIPMPLRDDDRTKYPKPNYYNIRLVLDNGICTNPDLCRTDTSIVLSYPSWITRQRFGDVIALYNEKYNGGYEWWHYQWYHGDELLPGETHEYLYVPTGLIVGDQYHVRLTRTGETQDFQTCPITIVQDPISNDYAPTMGYLAITPTCICPAHPYIYLLSRKGGRYQFYNSAGMSLGSVKSFKADAEEVEVPFTTEGVYSIMMWSDDTPEEPYRSIKFVVCTQCCSLLYENIPF